MAIGEYSKENNPAVHEPYDLARYYGKLDTPFGQVKLNEIGSWFGRRNKTPSVLMGACFWWKWQDKYVQPERVVMATFYQLLIGTIAFLYIIHYSKIKHRKKYIYR